MEVQLRVNAVLVPVAPSAGLGDAGVDGGGGVTLFVVNDQTGPLVAPVALFATIFQKYFVFFEAFVVKIPVI